MKYFSEEKVVIKSWCNNPEESALQQARNLANLPFVFKQVCLMPDTHSGYGMPIGGVIATEGVVIPNAVGVDIGCGMLAVKTSLTEITTEQLKQIMSKIREKVPVGFNHQKEKQDANLMPRIKDYLGLTEFEIDYPVISKEYYSALKQLGTLGGGNHFIEIQKGSDGYIWFMIHSGSRNLGKQVADYYNGLAKELNGKWYSQVPKEWDLAFLPIETEEAKLYLREMNYCLEFALANRKLMAQRIKDSFLDVLTGYTDKVTGKLYPTFITFDKEINIHHNYAQYENHFGKNVIVHRKGATSAREGEIGIVPGSQGTSSYIVKGLGNKESFMSCSHGAGRCLSRKAAREGLDLKSEIMRLEIKGIIHSIRNKEDLDESSGAYKDIDLVMEEQKDLVETLVKLEPLAVIKG